MTGGGTSSRWIDLFVERVDGSHSEPPRRLGQIYGPVPTGPIGDYTGFSAIKLFTDDENASWIALTTIAEKAAIRPDSQVELVTLQWKNNGLHIVFTKKPTHHNVLWSVEFALPTRNPLGPAKSDGVLELMFGLPQDFLSGDEFVYYVNCKGYVPVAGDHGDHFGKRTVKRIINEWFAHHPRMGLTGSSYPGPPPVVLDRTKCGLLFEDIDVLQYERRLAFEPTGDGAHAFRVSCGCAAWHSVPPGAAKQSPPLWPLGVAPYGGHHTRDFQAIADVRGWDHAPNESWTLHAFWSSPVGEGNVVEGAPTPLENPGPLGWWNREARKVTAALPIANPQSAGSILPTFVDRNQSKVFPQHWRMTYRVTTSIRRTDQVRRFVVDRFRLRVGKLRDDHVLDPTPPHPKLQASFLGFRLHTDTALIRHFELLEAAEDHDDAAESEDAAAHHVAFRVIDRTAIIGDPGARARIGALDLTFSNIPTEKNLADGLLLASIDNLGTSEGDGPEQSARVHRPVRMRVHRVVLGLSDVTPADQDLTEAEQLDREVLGRVPSSLVFDINPPAASLAADVKFVATFSESTTSKQPHGVQVKVEPYQGAVLPTKRHFVVLDTSPFLIASVALDEAVIKGDWSSRDPDGAGWRLEQGGTGEIILPPQAVGEEMIKFYDGSETSNVYTPDPNKPLAYKFSPPARLRMGPPDVPTASIEPTWNLRRLFGWPRERLPGRRLERAELELLYGLTTIIDGRDVRLVELAAAMGAPARALTSARTKDVLDQFASRLAYVYFAPRDRPYERATIVDRLDFILRPSREVAHPIRPTESIAREQPRDADYKPVKDGGLAGGVDWGFESENIYDEVRHSVSVGGMVVAPALTALGGFGFQKAAFANDKSRIYSNTNMGRTSFYSVERIGRIGVLWHRAKHVIIYERSAAASDQFKDKQGSPFRGRTVVRKVREYVELLERDRSYPDGQAAPATRGFVHAARFPERIPVNSRWGRDIAGGWVVPLFRPGEGSSYTLPSVQLQLATAAEPAWAPILNPEDLVFYTSTDPKLGSNTDEWPPVPGVDYPVANLPVASGAPAPPADTRQPDPPAHEPGYERFTFQLAATSARINLTAARSDSPIESALDSVTLARRGLSTRDIDLRGWGGARSALSEYADAVKRVGGALQIGEAGFEDALNDLSYAVATVTDPPVTELGKQLKALRDRVNTELASVTDVATTLAQRQADYLARWPVDWEHARETALDQLRALVEQAATQGAQSIAPIRDAATQVIADLGRRLGSLDLTISELAERATRVYRDGQARIAQLNATFTAWQQRLVAARDLASRQLQLGIGALVAELLGFAQAAKDWIGKFADSVSHALPGEIHPMIVKVVNDVSQALQRFLAPTADPAKKLSDAFLDWAKAFDPVALVTGIQSTLKQAAEAIVAKLELTDLHRETTALHDALDGELKQFAVATNTWVDQLELDPAKFNEFRDKLITATDTAKGALKKAVEDRVGQVKTAGAVLIAEAKQLDAALAEEANAWLNYARLVAQAHRRLLDGIPEAAEDLMRAARSSVTSIVDRLGSQLEHKRATIEAAVDRVVEQATAEAHDLGDRTMRLVRAYGTAPIAAGLQLSRDRLAYYFHEAEGTLRGLAANVGITPAAVLANRIGREIDNLDLKTVGLRLPTRELAERFLPDLRNAINLRDLFPDFAGIKLDRLFEGVGFPSAAEHGVSIKHGVDQARRSAWAQIDVEVPITDATVFSLGPFVLRLATAKLEAHTKISADLGTGMQRTTEARIVGDWRLEVSGQMVAALTRAELSLDNAGKLHFHVSPEAISVHQALQFLSKLMQYAPSTNGSGLTMAMVPSPSGIPIGIRAALHVALPSIQTGAFSISNLALSAHFELSAADGGFEISAGLGFATPEAPFNLSVLLLGGGGWLMTGARYNPFSGVRKGIVDVGLAVGASLPFDIGVARGGVWLLLSAGVHWEIGRGGHFEIILAITLRGEVVILSIVSVSLYLRLEAKYVSGGAGIVCSGYLSLKIKIGWFFSISVHHSVTFRLTGSDGSRQEARAMYAFAESAIGPGTELPPLPPFLVAYAGGFE